MSRELNPSKTAELMQATQFQSQVPSQLNTIDYSLFTMSIVFCMYSHWLIASLLFAYFCLFPN